jgi:hypothetical protein
VRSELANAGIDLDKMGVDFEEIGRAFGGAVRVVRVTPDIQDSVDEMGRSQRDHVVMVRVDDHTLEQLDAWVKTEAVKSRSEAAALFIREGLEVRASELAELQEALEDVDRAKERLKERVREVFSDRAAKEA